MPIFNHKTKGRVLFIHIPKTAGSSIEKWLQDAGCQLDKLNYWSGEKHQHAPREIYEHWGDFDYKFAVVRHPLTRFVSALGFRTVHAGDVDRTARDIIKKYEKGILPPQWGNHLQPQVDFIDDDVEVFKFEDDFFQQISDTLEITGSFPHSNKTRTTASVSDLSDEVRMHLRRIYDADYRAFGYEEGLWEVAPPRVDE